MIGVFKWPEASFSAVCFPLLPSLLGTPLWAQDPLCPASPSPGSVILVGRGPAPEKGQSFRVPVRGQCGVVLNGLRPQGRMTDQCWLWGLGKSPLGGAVLSSAPGDKDGTPRRLCEESVTGQVEVTMTVAEMLSRKLPDLLLINPIVLRS